MKKFFTLIGIAVFGLSLAGCEDQLTTGDATKVDSGTFTSSTAGLSQVLTSTYKSFLVGDPMEQPGASYQGVSGFLMLYDLMGSDCVVNKNYGSSPEPVYEFASARNQSTGDAHYIWERMYSTINEANIIIANIEPATGSEAEKKALLGQAQAIRGYCYFQLLLNYQQTYAIAKDKRGVILRLSPEDPVDLPFSTVGTCYEQVVKDLTDAQQNLSGFSRSERWQVDAVVAAAMLARVHQVMGNWEEAYEEAKKAYDAYGTLMGRKMWCSGMDKLMESGCPELIWGCKYTNVTNVGSNTVFNNWWNFDPSYGEGMQDGPLYHFLCIFVDQSYVDLFDDTDYRGTRCDKTSGVMDADEHGVMFWHRTGNGTPAIAAKWAYNKLKSYGDGTYKMGAKNSNANHSYGIDVPLMRGSEMLLIMAEAKANMGSAGEAKELLNRLQSARNAKLSTAAAKDQLLEAIYVERRKELLGEGVTGSYDLLRLQRPLVRYEATKANPAGHFSWGMTQLDGYNGADAKPVGRLESNDYRFICQIPQSEFINNKAVNEKTDQNPYTGQ